MKSDNGKSKLWFVVILVCAISLMGITDTIDGEAIERLLTILAGVVIGKYI